ncbi:MAG: SurA N-terminal domain-containing protein [Rhodocyclaceae bacterium]|jgi:peptidyl-prolyl cis-trans isomerase D|nr:SurA N-terminal domain-containing protein [Rhodocyclaceae bacterium]
MFEFVRNSKRFIKIVLAIIILPFALWGVDSYVRTSGSGDIATVGGTPIVMTEFQQALREQQERLRPMLGNANPEMLDSLEIRRAVLDTLINQRLLVLNASKSKLSISDTQLVEFIGAVPQLQENGKFSKERYAELVASQHMSKEMFEARLRQDLLMQQGLAAVTEAALTGHATTDRWLGTQLEEREIAEAILRPEQYAGQVKLATDAIKNYFDANRKEFETPEQVRVEFVVLSQEQFANQATVTEDELRKAYAVQAERNKQPETRRASHILITTSGADAKAAQAKAEELLAQLKKSPGDFAKLASQHSQDPGSAARGGDLDWFSRGMMVKPFEDAVFDLKENQISDLVRSDFGFHIIKLTGVRAERVQSFEEARSAIAAELKRQMAARKYTEAAESFINMVYEQSDSLKPVIEKFKLDPQQSDWFTRTGAAMPPFTSAKLMAAVFSDDVLKNKRNSEAIEVGPNTLVSARIIEHRPAALPSLESLQPTIEKVLVRQEAGLLAAKDGADKLSRLQKGENISLSWSAARSVARANAPQMSPAAIRAVFRADVAKLPAYAGAEIPGGAYAIYRIGAVKKYAASGVGGEAPAVRTLRQNYEQTLAEQELMAWIDVLRARHEVTINKTLLEAR